MERWNCVILIWNVGKGIKDITRGPQDQKIQVCINYMYYMKYIMLVMIFCKTDSIYCNGILHDFPFESVDYQSKGLEGGNFVPIKTQEVVLVW